MDAPPSIASTATAVPAHSATQEQVKARLREVLPLPPRRLDAAMELFDHTAVERRYSVEPIDRLGTLRGISEMQVRYRENAVALGRQVASEALARRARRAARRRPADHGLVHGDHDPVAGRPPGQPDGLSLDVRRLPITELGCVGGAAALARAHDFLVGFPQARALVVAVELPSLSMQRADVSPANLISTALFGDGAAAALLNGGATPRGLRQARSASSRRWRTCSPSRPGRWGSTWRTTAFTRCCRRRSRRC